MGSLYKDVLPGVVLFVASLGYFVMATRLPTSLIDTSITSSALPKLLGGAGMGLSAVLIVSGMVHVSQERGARRSWLGTWSSWLEHRRAFGIVAIVVGYALLVPHLGYLLALALMLAATAVYQNRFYGYVVPPLRLAAGAAAGGVLFWLIFVQLLGVDMPRGGWRHLF